MAKIFKCYKLMDASMNDGFTIFFVVLQEEEEEEEDIDSLVSFHKRTMASSTSSLRSSKVRIADLSYCLHTGWLSLITLLMSTYLDRHL